MAIAQANVAADAAVTEQMRQAKHQARGEQGRTNNWDGPRQGHGQRWKTVEGLAGQQGGRRGSSRGDNKTVARRSGANPADTPEEGTARRNGETNRRGRGRRRDGKTGGERAGENAQRPVTWPTAQTRGSEQRTQAAGQGLHSGHVIPSAFETSAVLILGKKRQKKLSRSFSGYAVVFLKSYFKEALRKVACAERESLSIFRGFLICHLLSCVEA